MKNAPSSRHPLAVFLICVLLCAVHGARAQTPSPAMRLAPPQTRRTQTPIASPSPGAPPAPAPKAMPASAPDAPPNAAVREAQTRARAEQSAAAAMDVEEFERLLAADSYALVGQVRDLAGTLNSTLITETLAPYARLGEAPRELTLLREFVARHAAALDSARVSFAAQPSRPGLPSMILRIRCADEQIARSLAAPLRRLLRQLDAAPAATGAAPTNTKPADGVANANAKSTATDKTAKSSPATTRTARAQSGAQSAAQAKAADTFFIKQQGAALFVGDTEFDLAAIKPAGDAPALADSANFQTAYARFAAAPLFVYYNLQTADRELRRAREEQMRRATGKPSSQAEGTLSVDTTMGDAAAGSTNAPPDDLSTPETQTSDAADAAAEASTIEAPVVAVTPEVQQDGDTTQGTGGVIEGDGNSSIAVPSLGLIFPSILGGASGIVDALGGAEALGAGLTIEASEVALRVMLVAPAGGVVKPVPFLPMLVGGAPAASRAAAMLPADTDIFFSLSVDLSRSYDAALALVDASARERGADNPAARVANNEPDANKISPAALGVAMVEQRYGFKIKDELLASLGGEIAFASLRAVPPPQTAATAQTATGGTATSTPTAVPNQPPATSGAGEGGMVFLVSVTDRERLKRLLPRALEAAGMAIPTGADSAVAANVFRKQGEIETIAISGGSAAFIGDYLVVTSGGASLDRIAELAHGGSSLLSSPEFTSARSWQPREKLAEVYISGGIAESIFGSDRRSLMEISEELKSYFEQFAGTTPEPFTYALTAEPQGTLHELRIPRSTIISFAAQAAADSKHGAKLRNERYVSYNLISFANAQTSYHEKEKRYGSIQELRKAELFYQDEMSSTTGYTLDLDISADSFKAVATPTEYNVTGRRSFYIDQSGTLRAADHGGRPATAADPQTQPR